MPDEKPLSGNYRVSFNVDLSTHDNLSQADIAQAIAEGFQDSVLSKLANLTIEDITPPPTLKLGDKVTFQEATKVKAHLYSDNGTPVIRSSPGAYREDLGELEIKLSGRFEGRVNSITKEGIEIIDFNTCIDIPLQDTETDYIEDTPVYIDALVVTPTALMKVVE